MNVLKHQSGSLRINRAANDYSDFIKNLT